MKQNPLRTSVIGIYPFPGWLEFASHNLPQFGKDDLAELQDDAVVTAVHDQLAAGFVHADPARHSVRRPRGGRWSLR